jgi:hypothetical protein
VGGVVAGVLGALETEAHGIDAGQEVLAAAEEHGGDLEVQLVDQSGREVLANGAGAAAEPDVLALSRLLRSRERGLDVRRSRNRRSFRPPS